MPKSALSIIAEQLPNFLREQQAGGTRGFVKGLGDLVGLSAPRTERSVFDPLSEEDLVRAVTHAGTGASAAAVPALRALGPTLRAIAQRPLVAGAAGTALTGDPTWLVSSPVGQALTYSSDAEASKFTDSLKAIDKFIAAHGTPHIFPPTEGNPLGAFDMSKLGTGEGAQAFMAGHYLAGDPRISRVHYRDRLVDLANTTRRRDQMNAVNDAFAKAIGNKSLASLAQQVKSTGKDPTAEAARLSEMEKYLTKTYKDLYSLGFASMLPETFVPSKVLARNTGEYAFSRGHDPIIEGMIKNVLQKEPEFALSPDTHKGLVKFTSEFNKATAEARQVRHDAMNYASRQARDTVGHGSPQFDDEYEKYYQKYLAENGTKLSPIKLGPSTVLPQGGEYPLSSIFSNQPNIWEAERLVNNLKVRSNKIRKLQKIADLEAQGAVPDIEAIKKATPVREALQGALYSVLVNESPGNMLPLNMSLKELREDMPKVYEGFDEALLAASPYSLTDFKGSNTALDVWNRARRDLDPMELMRNLNDQGIQGNMFLSSGRKILDTNQEFDPQAFNYVIFNDEVPQIINRELGKVPKFRVGGLAQVLRK